MSHIITGRPDATEYASYYAQYISMVPEEDILQANPHLLEQTISMTMP